MIAAAGITNVNTQLLINASKPFSNHLLPHQRTRETRPKVATTNPNRRSQPHILPPRSRVRSHLSRQARPSPNDALGPSRVLHILRPPDSFHRRDGAPPESLLRDHRLHLPVRDLLRMGLHAAADALRRRVSRQQDAGQGFRAQLPVPQHRHHR